ncbi:MAG: H-NS histone family protein [Myxococcales bacterium]|nr:H-NS histone family protein [Myxococcales bacterium]
MAQTDDIDLSSYTIPELEQLAKRVGQEISKKRACFRRLLPVVERGRALYRNPVNPAETWSGRGQQPRWFKQALARGQRPETLLN